MTPNRYVNPYIAGSVVTGADMFFGREDVFSFVRRHLIGLHRDTPVVLYGQRRTGKTSVLYHLPRHLDPQYRCVLIDLHGLGINGGMGTLLWEIASVVSRSLRRDYQIAVQVPDRATFMADPRSMFEDVFLDGAWAALGTDHLVLMVDEVARLEEERVAGRLEPGFFEYLRHLMQHYTNLNFIFSLGSGLEEMEKEYAFLFNTSLYHRISFLEPAAARALVTEPAKGHYELAPDAVTKILQITSGHPYYTQLVCHSLFDRWMQEPRPVISTADVTAVLAEAIELGSANLTFVWNDSTPEEQAIMAAMASVLGPGGGVTVGRVREVWREAGVAMPEGVADRAIRSLTAREVVARRRGYAFCVDLQRLWIRKHRRLSWVKDTLADVAQEWERAARAELDTRNRVAAIQQGQVATATGIGTGIRSFSVPDLARLYNFPPNLDGSGQCVGIIELGGGYQETEIETYLARFGLPAPKITAISVDGVANTPGDSHGMDATVALNVEIIAAGAPGAAIAVYFAPNTAQGFANAIRAAASDTDNNPSVLCIGWGSPESDWEDLSVSNMNDALKQAAALGITVFCAAGNQGPTGGVDDGKAHVDFPASSPYVLACGSTRISADQGKIETEVVWNDQHRGGGVTSGGFSVRFPAPDWQLEAYAADQALAEVAHGRGVPDVAINGATNPGYQILVGGQLIVVGGSTTSASLWAALIARLNQGLGERVGWLNPTLYRSLGPAGVLRDVTEGSTKLKSGELGYDARVGWDPCTGWGTPDGQRLLTALKVLHTVQSRDNPP